MKVTIEYDSEYDASIALKAKDFVYKKLELYNVLRDAMKHGPQTVEALQEAIETVMSELYD